MRTSILALLAFSSPAFAGSAGPLPDPLWSTNPNGIAYLGLDIGGTHADYAVAGAVTADGKLYFGGNVAVAGGSGSGSGDYSRLGFARMQNDGAPDTGFGTPILTALAQSNNLNNLDDMAVDAAGDMLFIGQYADTSGVGPTIIGRYTASGQLDTSFNNQGYRFISGSALNGNLSAAMNNGNLLVQGDGKILALINAYTSSPQSSCAGIVRLLAGGDLDTSFGAGTGTACYAPATSPPIAAAEDLAMLPDESILLAGAAVHLGGSGLDMAVARLTSSGALDTTFGNGGWAFVGFDQGGQLNDVALAIALDANGRIVIAGEYQEDATTVSIGVARLLADGAPDTSFGVQGRVMLPIDIDGDHVNDYAEATDVFLVGGGRVLIGGKAEASATGGYAVAAMLDPDGSPDMHFGNGGVYVQANPSTPATDVIDASRMRFAGDYLYFIGNSINPDNPGPSNAPNYDFAAQRLIVPLFRDGFDP